MLLFVCASRGLRRLWRRVRVDGVNTVGTAFWNPRIPEDFLPIKRPGWQYVGDPYSPKQVQVSPYKPAEMINGIIHVLKRRKVRRRIYSRVSDMLVDEPLENCRLLLKCSYLGVNCGCFGFPPAFPHQLDAEIAALKKQTAILK